MSNPDFETDGLYLHGCDMLAALIAASGTFQGLVGCNTPQFALANVQVGGLEDDDLGPEHARAIVKLGSNLQITGSTGMGFKVEQITFDVLFEFPCPATLKKYVSQYRWFLQQLGKVTRDMQRVLRQNTLLGLYPDLTGYTCANRPDIADYDEDQGKYYGFADMNFTARGSAE